MFVLMIRDVNYLEFYNNENNNNIIITLVGIL